MGTESIIIVGAGIAGLSAGCYARMNGFDATIFEMHDKPGGVCTAWKRKEYTFDGCIHWLVGSRDGSDFNRVWRELGALQGRTVVDHDVFVRVEGEDKALTFYTDIDHLERHMLELAPADSDIIRRMASDVRAFSRHSLPLAAPPELRTPLDGLKMLPVVARLGLPFMRWMGKSVQTFSASFTDPFMRDAFRQVFEVPDMPMIAVLMTMAWMNARDAGYPVGGSLEFSRGIEKRYLDLGGTVNYKSRVKEILVEADRAVGVRLSDGSEHRADVVISAADGHATIFDLLGGRYTDEEIRGYYAALPLFPPLIQVSLGVDMDFSDEPPTVMFPLARPVIIAGRAYDRLGVQNYSFDPTMAPAGKSALVVYLASDYDYWKVLHEDRDLYRKEKADAAAKVIDAIDARFAGLKAKVEVTDVATPMTYERYTGNWRASFEGWLPTTKTSKYIVKGMKRELPGLSDFFMIGQWVSPGGGLPPAAQHGREVIQIVCSRAQREFVTTEP